VRTPRQNKTAQVPTPHGGQVNKTYQKSLDLGFRGGC